MDSVTEDGANHIPVVLLDERLRERLEAVMGGVGALRR